MLGFFLGFGGETKAAGAGVEEKRKTRSDEDNAGDVSESFWKGANVSE
jgi:hypothetical protein